MKNRNLHRILAWVLILPFIAWSSTALFFLVRPAYEAAYETLAVKTYPLEHSVVVPIDSSWTEVRSLRTILGDHLLVNEGSQWRHLEVTGQEEFSRPSSEQLLELVADAISQNRGRYGELVSSSGEIYRTSTGVEITLDWTNLALYQKGRDTVWINRIYDIHYLRWTGIAWLDEGVGVLGLLLLMLMTFTGVRMLLLTSK